MYLVIQQIDYETIVYENQTKKQVKALIEEYKGYQKVLYKIYKVTKEFSVEDFQNK